jgi:hypothetical protein
MQAGQGTWRPVDLPTGRQRCTSGHHSCGSGYVAGRATKDGYRVDSMCACAMVLHFTHSANRPAVSSSARANTSSSSRVGDSGGSCALLIESLKASNFLSPLDSFSSACVKIDCHISDILKTSLVFPAMMVASADASAASIRCARVSLALLKCMAQKLTIRPAPATTREKKASQFSANHLHLLSRWPEGAVGVSSLDSLSCVIPDAPLLTRNK